MRKTLIILGVISLCLILALLGGFGLYLVMNRGVQAPARNHVLMSETAPNSQNITNTQNITDSPFANLPESAIPGRYRYISGDKDYIIILYEDHSFKNKDGTVLAIHRWDLTPEGLTLQWISNKSLYDRIEAPGIYIGTKEDGTTRRLEKQISTDPAELVKPNGL
jgi:hypothetical protein